jgi:amino-acid N-acetyltransferase
LNNNATIRKATPDDVDQIYDIISSYSEEGILLARTLDDISSSLQNFYIALLDSKTVGVITYFDYGDHLKEVRSLAVRNTYLRRGIGSALLQAMLSDITAANTPRIFVLTYAPEFFRKNGFVEIDMDTLPEKIWKDCIYCKKQDSCNETALEYAVRQ